MTRDTGCALLAALRTLADHVSLAEIERRTGVARGLLSRWLRGETAPSAPRLEGVLRAYGYDVHVVPPPPPRSDAPSHPGQTP